MSGIIDWIKRKLGLLTWSELVEYKKDLEYQLLYKRETIFESPYEDKILDEVFGGVSDDKRMKDRLTTGMEGLFEASRPFNWIVKMTVKQTIEEADGDVSWFKRVALARILQSTYQNESEIRQSLSKADDHIRLFNSVTLAEGYSMDELWEEFFAYVRKMRRLFV